LVEGQFNPGNTMLGFRINPSNNTAAGRVGEKRFCNTSSVTSPQRSRNGRPPSHFRLDNGDQSGLLAQGGVAGQCVALAARQPGWEAGCRRPSPRAIWRNGAHLIIFPETVAQASRPSVIFFSGMTSQVFGPGIHLDARNDARPVRTFMKGVPSAFAGESSRRKGSRR